MTNHGAITDFVHIGLVVDDINEAAGFLRLLGLDCGEPSTYAGEWIGRLTGLESATVEVAIARIPGASYVFELVLFHLPAVTSRGRDLAATEDAARRHPDTAVTGGTLREDPL